MNLKDMTIHEMIDFAKENPEEFEILAEEYQKQNIIDLCEGNKQCEWRYNGMLFRLNRDAKKIKNPFTRLYFVMDRFWRFIDSNY